MTAQSASNFFTGFFSALLVAASLMLPHSLAIAQQVEKKADAKKASGKAPAKAEVPAPSGFTATSKKALSPQVVAELALSQGLAAKDAEYLSQLAYSQLELGQGTDTAPIRSQIGGIDPQLSGLGRSFDLLVSFSPRYEINEALPINPSPLTPIRNTTGNLLFEISKRFRTGTQFSIDYRDVRQELLLPSFNPLAPSPVGNQTWLSLNGRQQLWANAFGYADRLALEVLEGSLQAALQAYTEELETVVLNSINLFWQAYIAEQTLKENMAARDKYDQLVKNVRRKAGFNLSTPGELPRLEAEVAVTEQRVKQSSADYLASLDALRAALQLTPGSEVVLNAPLDLPPIPRLEAKDLESLRPIEREKLMLRNAETFRERVRSSTRPTFDLVARARTTGQDREYGQALAKMGSGNYPDYFVGVEFVTPIDSSTFRGERAEAEVRVLQAENRVRTERDRVRNLLLDTERRVAAQYEIAKSAIEAVSLRERVVRELETAFRQGRQPLLEVIRAYNELFGSQREKANAIGQYHIALNNLAAARDELFTKGKSTPEVAVMKRGLE